MMLCIFVTFSYYVYEVALYAVRSEGNGGRGYGNTGRSVQEETGRDAKGRPLSFAARCTQREEAFRASNAHLRTPIVHDASSTPPPLFIDKTVKFLPSEYPVEQYVKTAFWDEGFTEVPDHLKADFVIGKASGKVVNWQICEGTMKHNHIPGQKAFVTKDGLARTLASGDHLGSPASRQTGIVSSAFFKQSFATEKPQDCDGFFALVEDMALHKEENAAELRRPQFIRKALVGGHNGKGLSILNGADLLAELAVYKETHLCKGGRVLVQRFLKNPYLVEGRTFNLRLFMLVLRGSPAFVVYYDGYLRLTKSKYNVDGNDNKAFISNSEKVWKRKGKESNDDVKHFWMLPELTRYMHAQGDLPAKYQANEFGGDAYLKEVLRPRIMAVFTHIFRTSQKNLKTGHQYFGVYGADMTLEAETLTPFVFEVNYSPELSRFVPLSAIKNMYSDIVTVELALMRNHTYLWEEIKEELRAPERFNVLVDDQKGYTFSRPDLFA